MAVAVAFVAADDYSATVKKVDGDKVTFYKNKTKTTEKGDDVTLPAAKDVVVKKGTPAKKGKVDEGDAIEGGLKNEIFSKISEKKGLQVRIFTSDDNKSITKILVVAPKGK
jgi:hypothetical protein